MKTRMRPVLPCTLARTASPRLPRDLGAAPFVVLNLLAAAGGAQAQTAAPPRLRYRQGFDAETLLTPGEPVRVTVPLTYVAHRLPVGSRLRLLISGSNFPWADPNPHTGEAIATAVTVRRALQTVFHDPARPSRLVLPTLPTLPPLLTLP